MQRKTVIIEDEEKSLYVLEELIGQYAPDFQLCGTASHVDNAIELIANVSPQVVFMDIRIADGTGFDVLQQLTHRNFELVMVTAYESHALEAFRFAAIDYILKPIGIQEFELAVERVRKRLWDKNHAATVDLLIHTLKRQDQEKKLSIATLTGYEFVDPNEIIWCKSDNAYTTFYLNNKTKLTSSRNIGFYERILSIQNFYRINHSIMINTHFIKSYVKGKGGYVIMQDGTQLEVSQRKKADFLSNFDV
ncbi:LytR/AlgR family response regulator transcription factor [Chryseosolibacter indicus]|uniref:LytTR family DNA-binding domain-containing protein n=1 Tax=Chryseosolibacter indicus TaxID=2782351 RepID=A0ABS5VYA8_9BACT|nr:LytTR family DNA-binding domain-containing protein [Chryseosolibacter indicus]MBT1706393.1 LytTR family DNA-binding domain-containing protein [Chryseosolibacter indicus]